MGCARSQRPKLVCNNPGDGLDPSQRGGKTRGGCGRGNVSMSVEEELVRDRNSRECSKHIIGPLELLRSLHIILHFSILLVDRTL
jgi:hypothetical protein